jgi:hypothetical protein
VSAKLLAEGVAGKFPTRFTGCQEQPVLAPLLECARKNVSKHVAYRKPMDPLSGTAMDAVGGGVDTSQLLSDIFSRDDEATAEVAARRRELAERREQALKSVSDIVFEHPSRDLNPFLCAALEFEFGDSMFLRVGLASRNESGV